MQATNGKQIKTHYPSVSLDADSLIKKSENSGYEMVFCSDRFFPGYFVFPLLPKAKIYFHLFGFALICSLLN